MSSADQTTNMVSPTGELGPRIAVLERIFVRIAEFEEEVRTGKRVIKTEVKGRHYAKRNAKPRQRKTAHN